jgi:tetratricopeptide (TPR) repeat protein
MKKLWLRTLRNSAYGFLCASFLAAPWASAQQAPAPAPTGPLPTLDEGLLTVLGIDKAQVEEGSATGEAATKIKKVRTEIQEAVRAFQQRNAQAALEDLEKAAEADPSLPPPSVLMARLCFASNDQNVVNLGRGFLERAVNFHKTTPEAYLLLGRLALAEGRLTDADLNFEKAQLYTPAAPGQEPTLGTAPGWTKERHDTFLKEVYAGQVSVSEQRQQWNTAENQLDAWIALDPNDAMAQFRKGRVLFLREAQKDATASKNYNPAREAFVEAYKLAQADKNRKTDEVTAVPPPELAMLQLFSGSAAKEDAEKEVKALEGLAEGFAEAKEKSRVYSSLSQWYLQQNNPVMAGELAAKAQKLDEKSPALRQLSAVMGYYSNNPQAIADFEKMNQEAPDDFVASNYLALLLAESPEEDKKTKAVRLAELNVRLNPKSPEAVSTLGWVYFRAGRTSDAMQVYGALLQAVQQGQGQINADTAYYMAKVIFDSPATPGRLDAVVDLLRRATGSTGPFKHRGLAEDWLEKLGGGGSPTTISTTDKKPATPTPTPSPAPGTGTGTTPRPVTPNPADN